MSLLVPDPEQPQEDGVELAVNPDSPVAEEGEALLGDIPTVRHPELGQTTTIFSHCTHT